MPDAAFDVAIVGAGAAGLLTAAGIAAREPGASIAMVDRRSYDAGTAYGMPRPGYLLNVRAAALGADPHHPAGFLEWARGNGHPHLVGFEFLPRALYGDYLRHLGSGLTPVSRVTDDVVAIEPGRHGWELRLASGGSLAATATVLALGNPPPRPLPGAASLDGVIADPLAPDALTPIGPDDAVVVVGAGLTAVDLILALSDRGRSVPVQVVSRGGRFPRVHCDKPPHCVEGCDAPPSPPGEAFRAALAGGGPEDVLSALREEFVAHPRQCWQSVFDQRLRGDFAALWDRWDDGERRRFATRIAAPFDRLRHRMAPEIGRRVEALAAGGGLLTRPGSVRDVSAAGEGLVVSLADGGTVGPVRWVLNATGPDLRATGFGPAVTGLVAASRARPGWGGLGIDVDGTGAVLDGAGRPWGTLFALGPPCRGARWETTAMPEVRAQADAIATVITAG